MGVLSSQLRCNRCGARLPRDEVVRCPNCHSELAQVGVWSELLEWGRTRQIGRTRYVWHRWVLGRGGLLALGMSIGFILSRTPWPVYPFLVFMSLFGGYCVGRWYWRSAEQEYEAAMK